MSPSSVPSTGPSHDISFPPQGLLEVRIPLLLRYYEMFRRPIARFDSLRFPSLLDTLHALAFRSRRRQVPRRRAGGFCFSRRFPPCGFISKGNDRASHVPGEPPVPMPCSPTPAGRNASGLYDASARPPFRPRRRLLTSTVFRGSITRPGHSLSTLRRVGRPTTTQDSLSATGQVLPDGLSPAGFHRKVSATSSHPPFPSFVCARSVTVPAGSFEV